MKNEYKYNAFISYRHISPDKEIADRLQKKLENYKLPKSLSKGRGLGNLHIFRDETELPTSSNLSNDIKKALEDSEFLIVICSKTTGESRWCMEEIEYFKQLHNGNNSKIITVVADGSPEEVFPPALCNELIEVTDDNGNKVYQNHIIEPMAANVSGGDLRKSLKKLNTEFLRIAAPLFGCGYDSLYDREHKKKTRKILAFGALALSILLLFGIYNSAMLWKINSQKNELMAAYEELQKKTEELEESNEELAEKTREAEANAEEANTQREIAEENMLIAQKNEANANEANRNLRIKNSEILATQAKRHLEDDDIFSAISSALEALPQEGEDIPSNIGAEYVLATSVSAYNASDKMVNYKIDLSSYVDFVEFSEDGTRLFSKDTMGNIYVIDYEKNKVIKTYTVMETFGKTTDYISDIVVDGNYGLVLCSGKLIYIDLKDGTIKWNYDNYAENGFSGNEILTNSKSDYIFLLGGSSYTVLTKDGQEVLSSWYNEDKSYIYSYDSYAYMSTDGTVYMVCPESSDIRLLNRNTNKIYPVEIAKNDEVMSVLENGDCIFLNIGVSVDGTTLGYNNARMICFNKKDMSVKWSTNYTVEGFLYNTEYNTMFEFTHNLSDSNGEYQKHNGILTVSGAHILCFDKQTGELYYSVNEDYEERILYCAPNTTEYSIKIATPKKFVTKAYLGHTEQTNLFLDKAGDYLLNSAYYTFDKERKFVAHSGDDKFALASLKSSEINMYHNTSFGNHTAFVNYPDVQGNLDLIADDGNGIFAAYYYNYVDKVKEKHVVIYDAKNDICKAFFKEDLEVETMVFKNSKLLMIDRDGNSKVVNYSGEILEKFNLVEKINVAAGNESTKYVSLYKPYIYLSENNIVICISSGIYTINLSQDNVVVGEVIYGSYLDNYCITDGFISLTQDSYRNGTTVIGYYIDKQLYFVTENGEKAEFIRGSISSVTNTSVDNKIAFISKEGYIGLYRHGNNSMTKILLRQGEITPLSIKFTPDGKYLIAMCADGRFIKYSADTGKIEGEYKSETEVSTSTIFEVMDNGSFYIQKYSGSEQIVVVDVNSMEKRAEIMHFIDYLHSEGKIIYRQYNGEKYEIGYYNYLKTAELIELAKAFLKGD